MNMFKLQRSCRIVSWSFVVQSLTNIFRRTKRWCARASDFGRVSSNRGEICRNGMTYTSRGQLMSAQSGLRAYVQSGPHLSCHRHWENVKMCGRFHGRNTRLIAAVRKRVHTAVLYCLKTFLAGAGGEWYRREHSANDLRVNVFSTAQDREMWPLEEEACWNSSSTCRTQSSSRQKA